MNVNVKYRRKISGNAYQYFSYFEIIAMFGAVLGKSE